MKSSVNTNNGYFGVANNFIDAAEKLSFAFDAKISGIGLKIDALGLGEILFMPHLMLTVFKLVAVLSMALVPVIQMHFSH